MNCEFTEKNAKKYLSYLLSHLSFSIRNSRSPKIYQIFFLKLKIFFPSLQKVNFKCKNAVSLVSEAKNNFIYDNVQGFLIFFKRVKIRASTVTDFSVFGSVRFPNFRFRFGSVFKPKIISVFGL